MNLFMMQTTTPSRRYPRLRRRYGWLGLALLLGTSLMIIITLLSL